MDAAEPVRVRGMDEGDTGPVSVVVTWDVKPGRERDFEDWAEGFHEVAIRYSGHRGATWLRAEGSRNRYYTVVNFSHQETLDRWLKSAERAEWIGRVRPIAEVHRQDTTGLETWFSLPGESVPAPSKLKMIIVTFFGRRTIFACCRDTPSSSRRMSTSLPRPMT